jgi:hypothetical protein
MMGEPFGYATEPRRRILGPLLLALLTFLGGLAIAAFAVHRSDRVADWLHPVSAPQPVARPVAAQQPVPLAAAPSTAAPDPVLTTRIDDLEARIDAVDRRAQAASGDADRAEGMLAAFAARRAVDRGQPLGYVEGLLRTHFGGTDAQSVAMVIGAGQRPVTLLQLQEGLLALSPTLLDSGANDTWWTGVRRELGDLFVIRKATTPSRAPDAQRGRALRALDQGQVELALGEVAHMPGAARAQGWMSDARRYVLAHNALDRLEAGALLKPPAGSTVDQ